MKQWETKKEDLKYKDGRFKIYENDVIRPDGKTLVLKRIDIKPGAHLVGLTDEKKIPLIRQYRHPASDIFLEIPSGGVELDKESYEKAAIREFTEETGFIPHNVQFVARYFHSPSLIFLTRYIFLTTLSRAILSLRRPNMEVKYSCLPTRNVWRR